MAHDSVSDRERVYDRMAADSDWDEFANTYETQRRIDIIFDDLLADTPLDGMELLDGGSGGGHFSAEACRRGAKVTSIDVGENVLAQVARRCDSTRVVGSILELPFDDGHFDVVLSTEVIEHTPRPVAALLELARVVRPGGTLVMTTPGRLWQPVVRLATTLKLRPYEGFENFVWPQEAGRVLDAAGIEIERLEGFNLLPLFNRRFHPFHVLADKIGRAAPSLFVNFGILGRKRG